MLERSSLYFLYRNQLKNVFNSFDRLLCALFEEGAIPLENQVEDLSFKYDPLKTEEERIIEWKKLLSVNFLFYLAKTPPPSLLCDEIKELAKEEGGRGSHYLRALVGLNHALISLPFLEIGPHLLENGAALIELKEYSPWLSLPYRPHLTEFALYLFILGFFKQKEEFHSIVVQIATWQLNTLNGEGVPITGLFVREKDGGHLDHLCLTYLLFRAAGTLTKSHGFESIAECVMDQLQDVISSDFSRINPLYPLIERWIEQYPVMSEGSFNLKEEIHDASTALVGFRSLTQHAVCTLHGAHTGLGHLRQGTLEVVNFGPHYFPLAECDGYGIQGNALSDVGLRRSQIESSAQSFVLKGCTRLVDKPGEGFQGVWMDVVQEFKRPHFFLKTSFLGLDEQNELAFSFFIKADSCDVQGSKVLLPQTLDCYDGEANSLVFKGGKVELEFRSLHLGGKMQVIPLGGGNSFWGADFLVAYHITSPQTDYQWHLTFNNRYGV